MLRNKQKGLVLLLIIALTIALSGCGNKDVIATYKGGKVTQTELGKFVSMNMFFDPSLAYMMYYSGFENYMLDQLITFKVLADKADKTIKAESDQMVKQQMDDLNRYFEDIGGRNALDKELQTLNLTRKDMQKFMQMNFYTMNSIRSTIAESAVKEEYDKILAEDAHYFDVATVRHILVMTEDPNTGEEIRTMDEALLRAREVRDKLLNNGDFAELAKQYSDDSGSNDKGGQYVDERISIWVPEFRDAAATLPINEISQPIEVSYGYHVLKVESRKAEAYETVKGEIQSQLTEGIIYNFMQNELPGLMLTNNLPQQQSPDDVDVPAAD